MKRIFTILVALSAFSSANAQLVSDNFNYNGLLTSNGWITHSGTAGQLSANGTVATLVAGNSEDVNKAFASPVTVSPGTVTIQYTATINFANGTGLSTTGDYFLALGSTAGSSVTVFLGRLFAKGSATGYTLGILNTSTSGGTATPTYGTEVAYNTPSNVTVTYTASTNVATLKIDAQSLLSNSNGTNASPTSIASACIRQGGTAASGTGNAIVDNLVVTNATLAVSDLSLLKHILVKNTSVKNTLTFAAKSEIQILNMNGQVVQTASVDSNANLDISALPKGIYLVKGAVNGEQSLQKIMKN